MLLLIAHLDKIHAPVVGNVVLIDGLRDHHGHCSVQYPVEYSWVET